MNKLCIYLSILLFDSDCYFCYLAICFFFSRGESDSNGIIRAFISNPKLIILISKTLIFIILGVDSLINNNSRAIIPLFSFFSGCLVFYYYYYCYQDYY